MTRPPRSSRCAAGFGVIELLIAGLVALIAVLGVGTLFLIAGNQFRVGSKKVVAQQEAAVLCGYLNHTMRVGAQMFVYDTSDPKTATNSGNGVAIYDGDGALVQRLEFDPGLESIVDSTGSPVTAARVVAFGVDRDLVQTKRLRYHFVVDDGYENRVEIESAASLRN